MIFPQVRVRNGFLGDIIIHRGQRVITEFTMIILGPILLTLPRSSFLQTDHKGPEFEVPINGKGVLAGILRLYTLVYSSSVLIISYCIGFEDFFNKWWPILVSSWLASMLLFRFPLFGNRKVRDLLFTHTNMILKPSELYMSQRNKIFEILKKSMIDANLPITTKQWEYKSPNSENVVIIFLFFIYALENDHNSEKGPIEDLLKKMHRNYSDKLGGVSGPLLRDMKRTIKKEKRKAKAQLKRFQQHEKGNSHHYENW